MEIRGPSHIYLTAVWKCDKLGLEREKESEMHKCNHVNVISVKPFPDLADGTVVLVYRHGDRVLFAERFKNQETANGVKRELEQNARNRGERVAV